MSFQGQPEDLKCRADEITPDEQGGPKNEMEIPEKSRSIVVTIHFNNINIDVSFHWNIKESTTIGDLQKKINKKMEQAFYLGWDRVRVQDLVKAENALEAVLEPGPLDKALNLVPPKSKKRGKNTLDINEYDPDKNLWNLVEERLYGIQENSTLKLAVKIPNRIALARLLNIANDDVDQDNEERGNASEVDTELFG